jgi:hypothetical protein
VANKGRRYSLLRELCVLESALRVGGKKNTTAPQPNQICVHLRNLCAKKHNPAANSGRFISPTINFREGF